MTPTELDAKLAKVNDLLSDTKRHKHNSATVFILVGEAMSLLREIDAEVVRLQANQKPTEEVF
ncbi:MAG: hypothetical protein V2A34_00280 [Lentisphaerota bacterium]